MKFKDHFSDVAREYASYRPSYPDALFAYLASIAPTDGTVWDCGCGNGQASIQLADYFNKIEASDPSERQIASAMPKQNVRYHVWPAEKSDLSDHSIDLVTVAQALHWFQFDPFYREVNRVLKKGGKIAAWCYALCSISDAIDPILNQFYDETLRSFWAPERRYIDSGYATIPFPFEKIATPSFQMREKWSLERFLGYLKTWSAVQKYKSEKGSDPVDAITPLLIDQWKEEAMPITWPLYLIVGESQTP
jgi:SAM-dependent methyltransferase